MENFEFISDLRFKSILERDYKELERCFEAECYKSVLVMSGSLIEALISEFFINQPPVGYNDKKILGLTLGQLIDLALSEKLIDEKVKSLSSVVRGFRNLIHPGRELRSNERFDKETANVSLSLVRIILKDIKSKYVEVYGYSAKDVFNKIANDHLSINIFGELVSKLNYNEKLKLLKLIIDAHLGAENLVLDNPKQYIDLLKPLIQKDDLIKQLVLLYQEVETGEQWEILRLYYLFKEDLNLLDKDKRELIIKYLISVLDNTKSLYQLDEFRALGIFSTITNYIKDSSVKNQYIEMLRAFNQGAKQFGTLAPLWYQLTLGFTDDMKKELDEKLLKDFKPINLDVRFHNDLNADDLPF